jgi:AcrR family transcriptional regulator
VLFVGDRADLDDESQAAKDGVDTADPSVKRLAAADQVGSKSGQRRGVGHEVLRDAIGKQLGVSGPALYRYFASRDELLTELVIDAYHDLADALSAAVSHAPGQDPRVRLEALARAYRSWALAQPHRYRLLYGPPLPGYDAHAQRLVDAAQAAMNLLLGILAELEDPTATSPSQPLASQLTAWAQPHHPGIDPATALRAIVTWSRLHGIVSLEIAGNFTSMGIDPGQLFEIQLATLTT